MLYDFFWRVVSLVVRFLRMFDSDIVASDLWDVKVVKLVNCEMIADPDIQLRIAANFSFVRNVHGGSIGTYMSASRVYVDVKPKVVSCKEHPKLVCKLYAPFASEANYTVTVRHGPSGLSECKTTLTQCEAGITEHVIFVQELVEKLHGRVLTWYHRNT